MGFGLFLTILNITALDGNLSKKVLSVLEVVITPLV
jgi:hypothetical protein